MDKEASPHMGCLRVVSLDAAASKPGFCEGQCTENIAKPGLSVHWCTQCIVLIGYLERDTSVLANKPSVAKVCLGKGSQENEESQRKSCPCPMQTWPLALHQTLQRTI